MPYRVCIALAMLISLISLGYRIYEWWGQVRMRVRTARHMGIETQRTRRETLLAKIAAAKRICISHILAFFVAVFEDIPMGTLTVIFTVRMYQLPIAVVLSLVTTCIMLGMKLNKLTLLSYWCAIAALRHPRPRCRCSLCAGHRWDKIGSWKAKLEDHEMADAVPNTAQLEALGKSQSSGTTGKPPLPRIVVAYSTSHLMPISYCPSAGSPSSRSSPGCMVSIHLVHGSR